MAIGESVVAVIRDARPTFRDIFDKIAFLVYAVFVDYGFVPTATGPQALSDTALSNPSTDKVGIDGWNELDGEYVFVYAIPGERLKKILVKCLVMNDKLLVSALSEGFSEPVYLEINVGEYAGDNGSSNYSDQFKNLDKFVKNLEEGILSKLEGFSRSSSSSNPGSSETSDRSRPEIYEPGAGFREPTGHPIYPSGDLYPGPGAGVYPMRGDPSTGGSMLVGPNDPRWFGGISGQPVFPGGQPGVPPGARFDPYGPPGFPGFEPNRFARNPRRPGHDTHPDLQHFRRDSDFI